MVEADEIIERLQLHPHPEGGHFRETWREPGPAGRRATGTAIYFLLRAGERSHWHRIDAAELWHFYAGAPLCLRMFPEGGELSDAILGPDVLVGHSPQLLVPPQAWQSAESTGPWSLLGCTVSPGFEFEHFEMAPKNWQPE